jgi:predicted small integral membrane protein
MNLNWMVWTVPTAVFFVVIALMLAGMTVWQIVAPSGERQGFLPIPTTPGDRLFIGLLGSAYIHLGWLAATDAPLWWALGVSAVYMIVLMRWG